MTSYSTHYISEPSHISVATTAGSNPILVAINSSTGGIQVCMTPEQLVILSAEVQNTLEKIMNGEKPTRDSSHCETPSEQSPTVGNYSEVVQRHKGADHYDTISNLAARVYQLESTIQRWVKNQE